ncbi:hypothetical protein FA15DRAFT_171196 [Coprinopsis marcescibilis]|uniref:Uncharacterized protein n=1 Tax=Coprinopsis marcescibilis TaxID=230819 RepID=A0A5C3L3D6_COPMA|nr:hypothetical protein FA15DRAFT_171196 [Coprinopsis marcescibilis]
MPTIYPPSLSRLSIPPRYASTRFLLIGFLLQLSMVVYSSNDGKQDPFVLMLSCASFIRFLAGLVWIYMHLAFGPLDLFTNHVFQPHHPVPCIHHSSRPLFSSALIIATPSLSLHSIENRTVPPASFLCFFLISFRFFGLSNE